MKKLLLLAVATIVALTTNARQLNVEKSANLRALSETMAPRMKAADKAVAPTKARSISRVAGDVIPFVEISTDWLDDEDSTPFNPCAGVSIVKSGETVDYNGEKMEKVTVVGICAGEATVDGYLSDTKLVIPSQKCQMDAETLAQYGEMTLMTYYINEAGTALEKSDADIVFEYADGVYRVNNARYYGLGIQMSGNYAQYIWAAAYFAELAKANGELSMRQSKGTWEEVTAPIYVELGDNGEVIVFNAFNIATLSMYIQEDNTVLIPSMQVMAATSSSVQSAGYGYAYYLNYFSVDEEGYLRYEPDAEFVPAVLQDEKTIAYEPDTYSGIFSNRDADGRGYYMGYQAAVTFTLNEGSFVPSSGTEDNDSTNINLNQVLFADPTTGKTYSDGETMRLFVTIDPEWGELMCPAPALVNNNAKDVNVRMDVNIKQLPKGTSLADCFSGKCTNYDATGMHSTATKSLAAGAKMSTEIEWNSFSSTTWESVYGRAIVDITLYVNDMKASTVTVEFDNPDPDSEPTLEKNVIYMNDITAKVGDVVDIDILMNNTKEVCGYQFDLYLPYGMELVASDSNLVSRGSRTTGGHALSSAARNDFYRVLSYSTSNKPYAGSEGDIVKIQVRLTAQMSADSAVIEIRNTVLSCTDGSTIYCDDTKATVTVEVEQIIRGDANDDGKVNVGDITAIANNILYDGTINEGVADVNNDSKINVSDISWIAHYIMTGKFYDEDGTISSVQSASGLSASLSMNGAVMKAGNGCEFVVNLLSGNADITGLQFDLRLPAGMTLNGDAQQNTLRVNDHVLQWTELADGVYRFLVYSASNGAIARGENAIITLPIAAGATMTPGQYQISIENVVITNGAYSVAEAVTTVNVSVEDPTAISSIEAAQSSQIYDLMGRQLKQAQKGVNIINGVKVLK